MIFIIFLLIVIDFSCKVNVLKLYKKQHELIP